MKERPYIKVGEKIFVIVPTYEFPGPKQEIRSGRAISVDMYGVCWFPDLWHIHSESAPIRFSDLADVFLNREDASAELKIRENK